ncbi:MAG: efflux transporter outer membrane subunit, partial [Acidobacteriaceae bacterium]|nr:efflux transporter outer membrane subunit [Acidobacteriaceae bacterium]
MRSLTALILCLFLTSCAVGPNYKRPVVQTPAQYRQPLAPTGPADKTSLSDVAWSQLFQDEVITNLVKTALAQSNDLEAATQRVLEARAQLGISRSQLAPQVTASGGFTASRTSSIGSFNFIPAGDNLAVSYTQAGLNLSWELDIWGRIRRLNESARAQYLAQKEARHAVTASLVADVITTYLTLRELDLELEIARKTQEIGSNGLKLTKLREERGVSTGLDVRQAEQLLYTATAQIAATQRAIGETENSLNVLLGQNPGEVPRGKSLVELVMPSAIPAGLPSDLLERRPDIREAEQSLIAANAQIGAAKAEFFPQISLTGVLGFQSRALGDLFTGPARNQDIAPAGVLPLFNAGQLRNNLRLTQAQQREAVANYRKTIQVAFQEVSTSLVDYQENRQQRSQEELLVKALQETDQLSTLRYKGGLDSYLQVLDAERNEFSGELTLAQLRKNEL